MTRKSGFQDHWLEIDPERMERYEEMFRWNPATAHFYDPADIREGHVLADFGCGPGHAAIEFARRVGEGGHVHALDINAEFVERTRARAAAEGLGDRVTAHLLDGPDLPLDDGGLDRVVARNTIIYVEDPEQVYREFRRVLRPGGIAHAIEGDWSLTAVAPVPTAEWRTLIEAASVAWPHPEIGRNLAGIAQRAGFDTVDVQVLTSPDASGRLQGMIDTVCGYARDSGRLAPARIEAILKQVRQGRAEGTYLALAPQFLVTARR